MTFSNPAASAPATAAAYVRALLQLLGDRDPLQVMDEQLPWLEERLAGHDHVTLRRPEAPGKWSVAEVVQHLADTELVVGFRGRMILAEDRPLLQGFDQDRWARVFRYTEVRPEEALAQLRALRAANLRLWRSLTPEQLRRIGRHTERGDESLDRMLRLGAAHDLVHRRQIDRVLAAVGAGQG